MFIRSIGAARKKANNKKQQTDMNKAHKRYVRGLFTSVPLYLGLC